MGIRKNAKFLSLTEKENYVKACVLMKADIVNPGAAVEYSVWDEYVAIHAKIQNATAPGPPITSNINFGHGGLGAYSFLSWHRYFLYEFELKLQTYVPGVMIPYWDWTDPVAGGIAVASFLGPNGDVATANIVNQGYFAYNKPGSAATPAAGGVPAMPANTTAAPLWWPASLPGWRLPDMFPSTARGGLKRSFRNLSALPSPADIKQCLEKLNYHDFQFALERGEGITSGNDMHDAMHPWVGNTGIGQMSDAKVSCFDPLFYVLHCNVDRLWAMWQMDGHATEYPNAGGKFQHHRPDRMYPYIGATPGYSSQSTTVTPSAAIPIPALPEKHNVDTLDFRALGYSYDSIPIIGLALDRTGSMMGLTPVAGIGSITKWDAATRGISAFLQDCETVKTSGIIYVTAGIKTFRTLGANDFVNVFGAPGYGLIKTGSPFSKSVFDGAVGAMTPGGGTPLADALNNVQTTLVQAPFGGLPANERRYMAFLTDGILTTGSPMSSIPNGSFTNTAIFAMGFGTGADVDYGTLASLVAKGITLPFPQVFHGDSAATLDKFYSNALARAIGFTTIFDPLIELFAGEHAHLEFFATSADDSFLITAQGMDFQDNNWSFMLHGPNDEILYGDAQGHNHTSIGCHHCCPAPFITDRRSDGRLTLVIQRGNTEMDCWVGRWSLMIGYKSRNSSMMMPDLGEMIFPLAASPIRGLRYAQLLVDPKNRVATRNVFTPAQHGLDSRAASTNNSDNEFSSIVVNIYGRTNLKLELQASEPLIKRGGELKIMVDADISPGSIQYHRAFVRFATPAFDIAEILPPERVQEIIKELEASKKCNRKLDIALILAQFEKEKNLQFIIDKEGNAVRHEEGSLHIHEKDTNIPGLYHFGVYIEGAYFPGVEAKPAEQHDHSKATKMTMDSADGMSRFATVNGEMFTRLLNITVAVVNEIIVDEKKA